MSAAIRQQAQNCGSCKEHKPRNARLPMMSHEIPTLPWETLGADLFYHAGSEYIVVVDYYSFYFEIQQLKTTTAKEIISFLTETFSTHGIPSKLITDNGPPFSSNTFKEGMKILQVTRVTSSPHYPRTN
ncbi:uncharacterized protein K02A2.6-like [Ornithodoros turicata]|uniref:uncharacterized protein K02A2.6-like n=1 Tax=Ornithodoros turicata TaxID=34597 RepID=UPI003138D395